MSLSTSEIRNIDGCRLAETCRFLEKMGLKYEGGAEVTVNLYDDDENIVGTGSLCGNILKYIAVDDNLQGEGGAASIVSRLVSIAYMSGRRRLFLFTKAQNEFLFRSLGFFTLASTDEVVYMENSRNGLSSYLDSLEKGTGIQGAVVANCNPFTLGHRYLMETAAAQVDTLHVFIVSEDASDFSFRDRFEMVRRGTRDIMNLILHESGDYIISHSTFPTYFIKSTQDAASINAELDLTLFGKRIAPALGITKRFVGSEPYCVVTNAYNKMMKKLLPTYGIEVIELPRKDGISASMVRKAMREHDDALLKSLLPTTSLEYIKERGIEL